jgi:hypothetical protein
MARFFFFSYTFYHLSQRFSPTTEKGKIDDSILIQENARRSSRTALEVETITLLST